MEYIHGELNISLGVSLSHTHKHTHSLTHTNTHTQTHSLTTTTHTTTQTNKTTPTHTHTHTNTGLCKSTKIHQRKARAKGSRQRWISGHGRPFCKSYNVPRSCYKPEPMVL